MPKRRVTNDPDKPPPTPQSAPPQKRTKMKKPSGDNVEMVQVADQENANQDEPSQEPENSSKYYRDSDYYFEDGNIVFCVDDTLFRVHKSLLKLQSKNPKKMFGLPTTPVGSTDPAGTCDENPVIVPDALHREFRNLMKFIYHPFSHQRWLGTLPASPSKKELAGRFGFLLDIVRMSHRFAMQDIEQWVKDYLAWLLRTHGKLIADGIDDAFGEEDSDSDETPDVNEGGGGEDGEDQDQDEAAWSANDYYSFRLMQAISYARDISNTAMLNDSLSALQYYCASATGDNLELFVDFLRIPGLRESNPALFGSLFLLLLSKGHQQWSKDLFTHMDRMALFSAQAYLTPLPNSLKVTLNALLFIKPDSAQTFARILSDKPNYALCSTGAICLNTTFLHWQTSFDQSYYESVNSGEFLVSTKALTTLSSRRLDFARQIICLKCRQKCYETTLLQLDGAIQDIHTKLAGYYKGFA